VASWMTEKDRKAARGGSSTPRDRRLGQVGEGVRELLPAILAFIRESGPDVLKEVAAQQIKEVPILRGLWAAAEKLSDEVAQRRVEEMLANVEAMTERGQDDLATLRDDTELLVALSVVMFTQQAELLQRLGESVPIDAVTRSAIDLALIAHRRQLVREHWYADHRGVADSANREEIASLPLDDVYVVPLLLSERERWKADGDATPGRSLGSVLAEHRRLVVLGDPGAGKSVLTRFVARICAQGPDMMELRLGWREEVTPVVLSLAAFSAARRGRTGLRLRAYLDDEMERRGGPALRAGIAGEFAAGRLLLLLDGVDEELDGRWRAALVQAVDELLESDPNWRCLVTSRPNGYIRLRGEMAHHTLLPFSHDQIATFVRGWHVAAERRQHPHAPDLAAAEAAAGSLLDEIRADARIESLAASPLMLVVISLIRQEHLRLPQHRTLLYERAVRTLMETWNDWRSAPAVDVGGTLLSYGGMVRIWGAVARWMHGERPNGIVHRERLHHVLVDILREHGVGADLELTADSYLNAAARQAGLLEERAPNVFAFWHPSFEEYLAATDLITPLSSAQANVLAVRDDPRWREVIVLAVGCVGTVTQEPDSATSLIQAILDAGPPSPLESLFHARLRLAAACVADDSSILRDPRDELIRRVAEAVAVVPFAPLERSFVDTARSLGDHEPSSETVAVLARLLTHREWDVCMEATRLLSNVSQTNPEAREACRLALDRSHNHPQSCHAAIGLARSGDRGMRVAEAVSWFQLPAASLEASAIRSVIPAVVETLASTLADPDWSVRRRAAAALQRLGEADDGAVAALTGGLAHPDPAVRLTAAEALADVGRTDQAAMEILASALAGPDSISQFRVAGVLETLARTGDERAAEALAHATSHPDTSVRARAACALVSFYHGDERATAVLLRAFADPSSFVRVRVAGEMVTSVNSDERAIAILIRALDDPHEQVRSMARDALAKLPTTDEREVEAVTRVLDDPNPSERIWAVGELGKLGRADERAMAVLIRDLAHSDRFVSQQAMEVLLGLGHVDERATAVLVHKLSSPVAHARVDAAAALLRLDGAGRREATLVLIRELVDLDATVRMGAAFALSRLARADGSAVDALVGALDDPSPWVRVCVAQALVRLGQAVEHAVVALVGLLDDGNSGIYAAAAHGLVTLVHPDAPADFVVLRGELREWFAVHGTQYGVRAFLTLLSDQPDGAIAACDRLLRGQPLTEADVAALSAVLAMSPDDGEAALQIRRAILGWLSRRLEV
jgi:HEAT repeat protein